MVSREREFFSILADSISQCPETEQRIDFKALLQQSESVHQLLDYLTASTARSFIRICLRSLSHFHLGRYEKSFNWRDFVQFQSNRLLQINELRGIDDKEHVDRSYKTEYAKQLFRVWAIIEFGVYNAANTSWSLLTVIPRTFLDAHGRLPSAEEISKIIASTEHVALTLASGEEHIFRYVMYQLRAAKCTPPWPPYSPSKFGLIAF